MSKGRPILHCRVDPLLIEDMEMAIELRNLWSREKPWTTADFLAIAIREKIDKMIRSRRSRPRKK